MRAVIVPKSDQLNADSLLGGPMTITVREVTIRPGTEQPVSIHFEGDNAKPYKPCKSMARVMVHCWGPDAALYAGRSMTIYCDPKVSWGGMAVGGIRISHMSHISGTQTMALTATKGNKKPYTVKPLEMPNQAEPAFYAVLSNGKRRGFDSIEALREWWLSALEKASPEALRDLRAANGALMGEYAAQHQEVILDIQGRLDAAINPGEEASTYE